MAGYKYILYILEIICVVTLPNQTRIFEYGNQEEMCTMKLDYVLKFYQPFYFELLK